MGHTFYAGVAQPKSEAMVDDIKSSLERSWDKATKISDAKERVKRLSDIVFAASLFETRIPNSSMAGIGAKYLTAYMNFTAPKQPAP